MKSPSIPSSLLLLVALVLPLSAFAEATKPALVGVKGKVVGAPVQIPAALSANACLQTEKSGAAMLVPVPGQSLFIDSATSVRVKRCSVDRSGDGTTQRSFACQLDKGHVHSSILASKNGTSVHEVVTSRASYRAKGTSWSTWTGDKGDRMVVFSGVVTVNSGGQSIPVSAGQVMQVTGSGDSEQVVVIDLTTGRRLVYTKGSSEPSSELASASELKDARDLMESALGIFEGTASADDKISFALLLQEINKVLAANLLPGLPPTTEWHLFPNQLLKGITAPESLASPEQPVN